MKSLKYLLFAFIICFICLNSVNAATCVYEIEGGAGVFSTNLSITCEIHNENIVCESNNNIKLLNNSLSVNNFKNGNVYICKENIYASLSIDNGIPTITNLTSNYSTGYAKGILNEDESNDDSKQIINNGPTTGTNPGYNKEEDTLTDLEKQFCTGAVQGVFTTLGWVFFILKILIPLILIIFGSIDLFKAVIASKDDEIKKSVKTLLIRAVAGIIIFFVPTFINFIVSVIDDDNVYNGDFADCTKCMLDPNDETCSGLRGENK